MVLRVRREHTEHTRPSVPTAACLSVHNNKIRERKNAAAAITARPYVLLHAIFSLVIHQFICHKNTGNLYTASYTLFFFLYLRKYLHFHLGGTQCVYAGGEASSSVVASKPIRRIVVFFSLLLVILNGRQSRRARWEARLQFLGDGTTSDIALYGWLWGNGAGIVNDFIKFVDHTQAMMLPVPGDWWLVCQNCVNKTTRTHMLWFEWWAHAPSLISY